MYRGMHGRQRTSRPRRILSTPHTTGHREKVKKMDQVYIFISFQFIFTTALGLVSETMSNMVTIATRVPVNAKIMANTAK